MRNSSLDESSALSLDIRWVNRRTTNGVTTCDLTFQAAPAQRRAASLVRPEGDGPFAVILYVHWYEPQACDSNRTQFLKEATQMAQRGAMSLLVEAMWSDREWFLKRTQDDDIEASIRQVNELRKAMNLLLSQPGGDPNRFAYVGHDFGAMYGVLAGSQDSRPSCYVLMAGTPRFPDWYLYYPGIQNEAREDFIREMARLDPIEHVGQLAPAPILFQFGMQDPHVPAERAAAFAAAAREPKQVLSYEAGHGLNESATSDRMAWLSQQLQLDEGER